MDAEARNLERKKLRLSLAELVPAFDHFNYQEILDWAAEHAEAKVEWINTFVDSHGRKHDDNRNALWSFYWKFGVIGLDEFRKYQGENAKMAAALFIFLYLKGIPADIADRSSTAYVHRYFGKITRLNSDGNS